MLTNEALIIAAEKYPKGIFRVMSELLPAEITEGTALKYEILEYVIVDGTGN